MFNRTNPMPMLKFSLLAFMLMSAILSFNVLGAEKFNAHKRYLSVQPGQTVFSLVKVLYPRQQTQWPVIIKKIVKMNPHAFVGGNAAKIKIGQRLALPAVKAKRAKKVAKKPVALKKRLAVGQVIQQRGKVFVLNTKKKKRNLRVGSQLFVGDRLFTGVRGFVRLNMIDDAKIDLRCNSEMLIEYYRLLEGRNRSVIHLLRGSVKKITGRIGKLTGDLYQLHTPLATVGVRGTEYALRVLQQHGCDGSVDVNSKGLFIKVKRGEIDVKSVREKKAVKKGEVMHLANKKSLIKRIKAKKGLFEKAPDIKQPKKSHVLGSVFWLLLLMPLIYILRHHTLRDKFSLGKK